ncbi:hypothetical protein E8E13_005519 [Curvularia kusanoi]|uniref:1-alkyl-2-acetylglycerophosphocholine esterase n=1 Tax=Curvularia kusanoi TaxID=90978 RepID=A0A9P4W4Y3_CURKU|nr:hypothetical protein E8E13_005519 [Curvularia kusanoi]
MLMFLGYLLLQMAVAVSFPPPTGPYHVGYLQHVFNKSTPNDPVAPPNSSILLATIYYPTLTIPISGVNTAPYLDPTTANIWGDNWQFPEGSLETLTTWNVQDAPPLERGVSQKPTIVFSPGAGENAIMYSALNSELGSQGYTVIALDHPGEAPYLQLPDSKHGIYGIDITAQWNQTFAEAVYHTRVSDILAVIQDLLPPYVSAIGAPFNTTHFIAIGHSLGGAAAASALAMESRILGGVNFDGTYFESTDAKKPFLMLGQEAHTLNAEPSWPGFAVNQSGWWRWLNVAGSGHQNFADLDDWVDLLGLRNKTAPLSVGAVWAPRMNHIIKTLVQHFLASVLGETEWEDVQGAAFPEVVRVTAIA